MQRAVSLVVSFAVFLGASLVVDAPRLRARQLPGEEIRRARHPIPGQYIVVLRKGDVSRPDPEAVGGELANLFGGRALRAYRHVLEGFALRVPEMAAQAIGRDPRVQYVEEDSLIFIGDVQQDAPWGLDRTDQRDLPLDSSYTYAGTASTVNVYVLDTGIRTTHQEFEGRAFIAADHIDDDGDGDPNDIANDDGDASSPDGSDCHGHGTHVAGIIGGRTYGIAKGVVLWGHRVLGCDGSGLISTVISAIDAVTATHMKPALANLSLGSGASTALDEAVENSIAAGVTYVVAAGNDGLDARATSPARVAEAITVGATNKSDGRATFSNYGPALDLFAPGAKIKSAWITDDTAAATASGTSMATPHVAGIAALYLENEPDAAPSAVRQAVTEGATPDRVIDPGDGSPNLLLYSGFLPALMPDVTVAAPNGGEKAFTETSYLIEWTASDEDGLKSFDVEVSVDGGGTFSPVTGCTGLGGDARSCVWSSPGPATTEARIRVLAHNTAGNPGADVSDADFGIVAGAASMTVTSPNKSVNWGVGSTQQIKWKHNLGAASSVTIEISRDGGTSWSTINSAVKNSGSGSGIYNWVVTDPNTSQALIRARWTSGPAGDTSDNAFTIANPFIKVKLPKSSGNWGYDTTQKQTWSTNLGLLDKVNVLLSVDGGVTFPTTLAANATASKKSATFTVPVLPGPTSSARIRVEWAANTAVQGVNPANFTIEPPFVAVAVPNLSTDGWTVGERETIRWTNNLGKLEKVKIELSTDEGASYPIVLVGKTPSDGKQAITVQSDWATASGRVRIVWSKDESVVDASDQSFPIQ